MKHSPDADGDLDLRRLRTLYRALGDATRLRIVGLLAEQGPMAVNEVSVHVGLSQPLISWHLRILRLAGLISTERRGRETRCALRHAAFDELHAAEARLLAGGLEPETASAPEPAHVEMGEVEVADVR